MQQNINYKDRDMKKPSENSKCLECLYFINESPCSCGAFVRGIPDKYLDGSEVHDHIEEGQDTDIVFKQDPHALYPMY